MTAFDKILNDLVGKVAASAGASVANTPQVQQAVSDAKAQLGQYKLYLDVAAGLALFTFVFYILPRAESPIPRVWRSRR
ncbi:MAG: hypothetical protein KGO96_13790 [Elusimicrobia bacterium]|nr:hypothetical protein [Elusimicrobiota bacterium]MDE2236267.1 hypothetical protein [Elusimicrobiota bacterium]MDE2426967.1 hypothetical protein [Elusimicrobiota bacterium]